MFGFVVFVVVKLFLQFFCFFFACGWWGRPFPLYEYEQLFRDVDKIPYRQEKPNEKGGHFYSRCLKVSMIAARLSKTKNNVPA